MNDTKFLHIIHSMLKEYQRQRGEPSVCISKIVLAVERELQNNSGHFWCLKESLVVEVLIIIGLLDEQQRGWAEGYYKRDPESFRTYIKEIGENNENPG